MNYRRRVALRHEIRMRIMVHCGLIREERFTVVVVVALEVIKEAAMKDKMREEGSNRM